MFQIFILGHFSEGIRTFSTESLPEKGVNISFYYSAVRSQCAIKTTGCLHTLYESRLQTAKSLQAMGVLKIKKRRRFLMGEFTYMSVTHIAQCDTPLKHVNPFTAPACKMSGCKLHTGACKRYIFRICIKSNFNIVRLMKLLSR